MRPEVRIQALQPAHAERVQEFVRALSPQSRRERYFCAIRELSPRQLERLTLSRDARDRDPDLVRVELSGADRNAACLTPANP